MITVACVLKSGGIYTPEYVHKLKAGVDRNLKGHKFVCLSDVEVKGVETIPLKENWPGWWSKLELFKNITGPTLYLDLDTLVLRTLEPIKKLKHDFMMIDLRTSTQMGIGQSGVMWITKNIPKIYDKFKQDPEKYIKEYSEFKGAMHIGDQAFIFDTIGVVPKITQALPGFIRSYKLNCLDGPMNSAIVCFHGEPRLHEVNGWAKKAWSLE